MLHAQKPLQSGPKVPAGHTGTTMEKNAWPGTTLLNNYPQMITGQRVCMCVRGEVGRGAERGPGGMTDGEGRWRDCSCSHSHASLIQLHVYHNETHNTR